MHQMAIVAGYAVLAILGLAVFFLLCWLGMGVLNIWRKRPPFVPVFGMIMKDIVHAFDLKPGDRFYDLGSGDGRVLLSISKAFPETTCIGIEYDWMPYAIAKIRCHNKRNIHLQRGDFFQADLSAATHIFTFLFPEAMDLLLPKLQRELRPGTRLISCDFKLADKEPVRIIDLGRKDKDLCKTLYVYEF